MAYSDFTTIDAVEQQLGIRIQTSASLFPQIAPSTTIDPLLTTVLADQVSLALRSMTEKAASEYIIAPILLAVWRSLERRFGILSGRTFDVDPRRGLVGACDFVIQADADALTIRAPILCIVEAKKDDFVRGIAQCSAELVAAHFINTEHEYHAPLYGCVTNGTLWRFLRMHDDGATILVDSQIYTLDELPFVLAILQHICGAAL